MNLWRVVPLDQKADPDSPGGALWFPRQFQGAGRHDNPDLYGCLYVAENPVSAIAEHLAPFRGTGRLLDSMLTKLDLPLALVALELADGARVVDLDDPIVLQANELRPSQVATRKRNETQDQAAAIFKSNPDATGIRWWSTLESSWINVTMFDRCLPEFDVIETTPLTIDNQDVIEAAEFLGLRSKLR